MGESDHLVAPLMALHFSGWQLPSSLSKPLIFGFVYGEETIFPKSCFRHRPASTIAG